MKSLCILICISLIGSYQSLAQDHSQANNQPPRGFLSILWADSPDTVKAKMLMYDGVRLSYKDSLTLQFFGGKFMDHDVLAWTFGFSDSSSILNVSIAFKADSADARAVLRHLEIQCQYLYGTATNNRSWAFEDYSARQSIFVNIKSEPKILAEIWYSISDWPVHGRSLRR